MLKKTIAILFGGCSAEYDVSLKSAAAVISNIDLNKYNIVKIGITKDGEWFRYYGDSSKIEDNTWWDSDELKKTIISPCRKTHGFIEYNGNTFTDVKVDIVFPVLHGKNGEDGTLQGLLQLAGIPFIGCGTLSSALCMDKELAHSIVKINGVKTPKSVTIQKIMSKQEMLTKAITIKFPMFVKPANSGSSFGITKVMSKNQLSEAFETAFQYDNKVIIEEDIEGVEVGCAVLGNNNLILGEVDEIELQDGFFDYTEKYTLKTSKIHMPARIDEQTAQRIKETAITIYRALECKGFARVDMFLTTHGEIIFNEVNTIPGFTAHSRYPNMLKGIGLTYGEILDKLIALAEEI